MFKIDEVPFRFESSAENYWDEKGQTEIHQIFVSADEVMIRCLQFQYNQNDCLILSPQHGKIYGPKFYPVRLDYPSEFLTRVSGKYGDDCVKSIMFTTNRRTFGPYGCNETEHAADFDFCLGENNQFGGFHGSCNRYGLRSIGVYFNPNITTAVTTEVSSVEKGSKHF